MFIVSLNYKKEISEVEKYLKEHVDFLINIICSENSSVLEEKTQEREGLFL